MKNYFFLFFNLLFISNICISQTPLTATWSPEKPPTELEIGTSYTFSASYDAGDNGSGTDYLIGGKNSNAIQFSILEKSASDIRWRAGKKDSSTAGTHAGVATIKWRIPKNLTPSAELDKGNIYVLRIIMQNNQNQWFGKKSEIPITISAIK